MFGSQILEVAIGVIFVFVLISIICTVIREGIEAWLKTRAAFLEYGIRELLHDRQAEGLAKSLYNHPLIYGLYAESYSPVSSTQRPSALTNGGTLPSYIPTRNFALALMDLAARGPVANSNSSDASAPRISLDSIRANIKNLDSPEVQRVMLTALDVAQGDLDKVQAYLEAWYDSGMDRVAGWYKRSSQWVVFWIALAVSVGLNVNTITIASYLSHNDVARATLIARAGVAVKDTSFQRVANDRQRRAVQDTSLRKDARAFRLLANQRYREARQELDSLTLPIGWASGWGAPHQHGGKVFRQTWNDIFAPLLGWLMTAFAAMLGAPFWFDVLNKIMVIRSTVKPHEKSQEEDSEDRQLPKANLISPGGGVNGPPPSANTSGSTPHALVALQEYQLPAAPRDEESIMDGCDVVATDLTPDEHLPAAEGGIA